MLKSTHPPSPARNHLLASRAREMRRLASEPERLLWSALSASQLGLAFRRQVVLGNAIADFFAPSLRLVVEVCWCPPPACSARARVLGRIDERHVNETNIVACLRALRALPARALPLPNSCSAFGVRASGRGGTAWRSRCSSG